ncbi:MAG TPA: MBL fold metallo-hydrolase [Flavobacteriales bacterium]|nr:MBL fold metallo-hydrolase [Flavobacteriales bacterium]
MKVTFLGSGTSQGVPVIACDCKVCTSMDSRDKRLRSSIMLSHKGKNYVIDCGPDFRQQMLVNKVNSLSAILLTHEHKDHVAGLDDVRAYNFREKKDMEVFCSYRVEEAIKREYHYIFAENKYPGSPSININRINSVSPFNIDPEVKVMPIEVMHHKLPVLGFRFGDFSYITDAKTVSAKERNKIRGSKILVVNALRQSEHISHFNLEEALNFIKDISPEKAYLTHISHLFGTHEEIQALLPVNVDVAHDGLTLQINI